MAHELEIKAKLKADVLDYYQLASTSEPRARGHIIDAYKGAAVDYTGYTVCKLASRRGHGTRGTAEAQIRGTNCTDVPGETTVNVRSRTRPIGEGDDTRDSNARATTTSRSQTGRAKTGIGNQQGGEKKRAPNVSSL